MHKRLSVDYCSYEIGLRRERKDDQQTSEIKLTLERPAISLDYSRDTCNASLTSKPGEVVGSADKLDAAF